MDGFTLLKEPLSFFRGITVYVLFEVFHDSLLYLETHQFLLVYYIVNISCLFVDSFIQQIFIHHLLWPLIFLGLQKQE